MEGLGKGYVIIDSGACTGVDASMDKMIAMHDHVPPWPTPALWRTANQAVLSLLANGSNMLQSRQVAATIGQRIASIDRDMQSLCQATCPTCAQPCCLNATVWYDFRDLLYLHASEAALPLSQISRQSGQACPYLSPTGCMLSRNQRPFICTWYICPPQVRLLDARPWRYRTDVRTVVASLKGLRRELERLIVPPNGECAK